jgi:uncharacterized protein YebE (UPF0316 family)
MLLDFNLPILLTGLLIFILRVGDVSLGTLRTISIVQGRTSRAFMLGFVEVSMWLVVMSTVLSQVASKPILGAFFALGFSTGNVVGILVEKQLIRGHLAVRVLTAHHADAISASLRAMGLRVTILWGDDGDGPVGLLYIICDRKQLRQVVARVKAQDPDAMCTAEQAGLVGQVVRPMMQPTTGWRSAFKRK